MTYQLKIEPRPGYLHAIVTGTNSKENVAAYFEELFQQCLARRVFKVLIEEKLAGPRLSTLEVFELVSAGANRTHDTPAQFTIAFVDVNVAGDLMQFAETVALNRSLPARVFATVAAAEEWLRAHEHKNVPGQHSSS